MNNLLFKGASTALVTPMDDDGKVDYSALDALLDYQLQNGIQALVALGTTGEPSTLTQDEYKAVLSFIVKKVNKRIPVIAGTGGNNTLNVVETAHLAADLGADAQLCVSPYYNKTTQEGVVKHYEYIANHTSLPMIVYHVPARTGLTFSLDTVKNLSQIHSIVGLKEASSDMGFVCDILHGASTLPLYSGSDEINVPMMTMGAQGFISVLSNVLPKEVASMAECVQKGDIQQAVSLQLQYMPLTRLLFSAVNPIPVKCALSLMGIIKNNLRLPLIPLSVSLENQLKNELKRLEII